jgi:hypothetical protein
MGAPLPGTWKVEILSGGFVYLGTPKDMQNKALETGRSLYSGRVGKPGEGFVLPETLRNR